MLDKVWESVGEGYFMPAFGHWDIVHIILDLLCYDVAFAAQQTALVAKTIRAADGRLPGLVRETEAEDGARVLCPDYAYSPPPLWPVAAAAVAEAYADRAFTAEIYAAAAAGARWYEEHRRLANGLFWFHDSTGSGSWESGYDACPRWDGIPAGSAPFACIDLCGQMGLYYTSLAAMAGMLGDGAAAGQWRGAAEQLAGRVRDALWHEGDGLFYDRRTDSGEWIRVKTAACFWPMAAGQSTTDQAARLAAHLADPEEFLAELPIPSVALNDPTFSLDCWRGPAWLSQTYWAMKGLRRYGHEDLAREIGRRALGGVAAALEEHGTVFEFFHPNGGPVEDLARKGKPVPPRRDYIGHNPIHAIALASL